MTAEPALPFIQAYPGPEREDFKVLRGQVVRSVRLRNGGFAESTIGIGLAMGDLREAADAAFLRASARPVSSTGTSIRVADLFSGCGAMTLGLAEACRAVGKQFTPVLACDINPTALEVYADNFEGVSTESCDLGELSGLMHAARTPLEVRLTRAYRDLDFVVAGPPCQGHSNLNNRTRRNDPKNALYLRVARFAKLFEPRFVLVENVPTVLQDHGGVVFRTRDALEQLGYRVMEGIVDLSQIGVAQSRRRHVLIATRSDVAFRIARPSEIVAANATPPRSVEWAIGDLLDAAQPDGLFDAIPSMAPITRKRIDHLFNHDLYDLPNSKRPDCHRTKEHTYTAVYGRMRWDRPAPTITTGFGTMGQGRFVHPLHRRTITAHEAARLQFIPDFFTFRAAETRKQLAELIGNAVPPKLSYVVALELLR